MRKIFTVFGAISALVVVAVLAGLTVLATKALVMADQNKTAAVVAVQEISKDWSVKTRQHLVASSLIKVAQTPKGSRAFNTFSRLGNLVKAEEVAQTHFGISTETGTTATITFSGRFRNGSAEMTVRLRKIDGTMKVIGLETKQTQIIKTVRSESAWLVFGEYQTIGRTWQVEGASTRQARAVQLGLRNVELRASFSVRVSK